MKMIEPENIRAYLAGPFFKAHEKIVIKKVEAILHEAEIVHFSPFRDLARFQHNVRKHANDIFQANVEHLNNSNVLVACIDDFDPGTMFECGVFDEMKRQARLAGSGDMPQSFAFSTQGHGLNLMLAQSFDGFFPDLEAMRRFFVHRMEDACRPAWVGEVL